MEKEFVHANKQEHKKEDKANDSKNGTIVIGAAGFGHATSDETLSRGNPIAEFLRNQKGNIKDMNEEDFLAKYEAYMKEKGGKPSERHESKSNRPTEAKCEAVEPNHQNVFHSGEGNFENIVLKFTTLSENCFEAPSFTVDRKGAKIGRDPTNDICVSSDQRLAPEAHSTIEYYRGAFYIYDGGFSFSASVRIGLSNNGHMRKWHLDRNARFSAGNSVIQSRGVASDGQLELLVIEGPLKGQTLFIGKSGATFGRSSDNTVCIPDRELSRRHSRIDFEEKSGRYIVSDMNSTNGTYIQLVGPYGGRYKLNLNDNILVGRTGFSINRYDYGLSEEMGYRQSMEDACTIVQHLDIGSFLSVPDLSPQSFFGVFDGHGGVEASHYLAQHLHINVASGLEDDMASIFKTLENVAPGSIYDTPKTGGTVSSGPMAAIPGVMEGNSLTELDRIVIASLKRSFLKTDQDFIDTSEHPQHGSTCTTALVLGRRLYCANVGDSRSMMCRNFSPVVLSEDHKPTREDEAKRIRDAGGFVINNRVMGELAVSRAFGDVDFKKGIQGMIEEENCSNNNSTNNNNHNNNNSSSGNSNHNNKNNNNGSSDGDDDDYDDGGYGNNNDNNNNSSWDQPLIIAEPDVKVITITEQDQFLLLGCDGLFDVYTPEEVVNFVKVGMEKHGDAQKCCQSLTHDAIRKRNSRDNVSVILIILNKWY